MQVVNSTRVLELQFVLQEGLKNQSDFITDLEKLSFSLCFVRVPVWVCVTLHGLCHTFTFTLSHTCVTPSHMKLLLTNVKNANRLECSLIWVAARCRVLVFVFSPFISPTG